MLILRWSRQTPDNVYLNLAGWGPQPTCTLPPTNNNYTASQCDANIHLNCSLQQLTHRRLQTTKIPSSYKWTEFRLFFHIKGSWWDCCTVAAARQSCPMKIMTTSTGPAEMCGLCCTPGIVLSKHAYTPHYGRSWTSFQHRDGSFDSINIFICSHKLSMSVPISSLLFLH